MTAPAMPGSGRPAAAATTRVLARPGARLAYQVTGGGPAVVLVHGFGLDMRMWEPQAQHLAARYQVIRYDCRGFGSSGPFDPGAAYTHAGDLLALLDHLGIGQAVLARRIPGARYHVVAGAGHLVNMEQPAAVNEALARFLDELPPLAAAQSGPGEARWNR